MHDVIEWLAKFFGHITVDGVEAMLIHGVRAVLVLLAFYLVMKIICRGIDRRFANSDGSNDIDIATYKKITSYSFWTIGSLGALHAAGLNLSSLFTTSGLLAVALGFGMKEILENYVAGLIIKADQSIKQGDVLDIDGVMVKVKKIGVRETIVRTKKDSDILIPNSRLLNQPIGNYTLRDSVCRVWSEVGVSYASDMKHVREVLEAVCREFEGLSESRRPVVLLSEFGDSSVVYQVYIWVEHPWSALVIRSKLNEAIWWALKGANIEIAFPQVDVHIDKNPGAEGSLDQVAAGAKT
jgi:potassium efflux system protein